MMFARFLFSFCVFVLNLLLFSWGHADHEFDVVSTSQRPSDSLKFEQVLNKLDEISNRLKALELQNVAFTLKLEQALIKQDHNFKEDTNSRLEELKSENVASTLKINSLIHRLEALESQNVKNILMLTHLQQEADRPKNCQGVKEQGYNASTTYLIKPDFAPNATRVLCDLEKKGGGWTYILNRFDGSQSFDFDWEEYKIGFGNLSGEFWLGLNTIHHLTGYQDNELLVELVDWENTTKFAHYDYFTVGSENESYVMKVLGYNGTAGDSLSESSNMKFSTGNKDHDNWPSGNCAKLFEGSWWYHMCMSCLLTGKYLKGNVTTKYAGKTMFWNGFHSSSYSLKEARMMVRPRDI